MLARLVFIIGVFAFVPLAQAQFMGSSCPYPTRLAPNAVNRDDVDPNERRLKQLDKVLDRAEDRKELLIKKVEAEERAIRARIDGEAADVIIRFLESNGRDDGDVICPPSGGPAVPYEPGPVIHERSTQQPAADGILRGDNKPIVSDRLPAANRPTGTPAATAPAADASNDIIIGNETNAGPIVDPDDSTSSNIKKFKNSQKNAPVNSQVNRNSEGRVPGPPPSSEPEHFNGQYVSSGHSAFCAHGENFWNNWRIRGGKVHPNACREKVFGLTIEGSQGRISACTKALIDLGRDYKKLQDADLDAEYAQDKIDALEGGSDRERSRTEGRSRSPRNDMQTFMNRLVGMKNMFNHRGGGLGSGRGPGGPGGGGWPMAPGSSFAPYNYNSMNPGMMSDNNGWYGGVDGSRGQGAFGCNGLNNNPNLYGNQMNAPWGSPGGFRPPYPPWSNGAPYALPMPNQRRVLPMPGGQGGLAGRGGPGMLPIPGGGAVPYMNGNGGLLGLPAGFGGYGGAGIGGYAGAGLGGYTGGYAGGGSVGFSGDGFSPGSIRPLTGVSGTANYSYAGGTGTGFYGGGYGLSQFGGASGVPPILQPPQFLGGGTGGTTPPRPAVLPTHP